MTSLLNKLLTLLAHRRQEYLTIDQNFNILEASFGAPRFADCPHEVEQGKDIHLSFPELIGLEDILKAIAKGQESSFELKGIARNSENGSLLYFDLSIINNPDRKILKGDLIVFLEDVTEKMVLEQSLVQASNEKSLLLEALAVSKDYVDKIIRSMADALLVTTASGTIKRVNLAAQGLFEYTEDELLGKSISTIILDQDFLNRTSPFQNTHSRSERSQVVCQTKTGRKVCVAFSRSVIQSDIEGLYDFAYVGRDITEQKRSQQRLAAQYAITRILTEATPLKETLRKILQAICKNLEWELGELWTPDEYLGKPASGLTRLRCVDMWVKPGVNLQSFAIATWQTTLAPGDELPGQIWATRSPQWIADVVEDVNFVRKKAALQAGLHGAFGFPIQDDGEILGVMAFFSREVQTPSEDLLKTMAAVGNQLGQFIKRKQAEKALQESEERYRDLFENATDLIQACATNGQFIYVNRAWRETLGYSEAQVQQMSLFDIIHPDCKEQCLQTFYRVMAGETIDQVTAAFISKDGKKISVEGNVNCKFIEGSPVATRAIFRDITKRLETEAALHQQQKRTERLLLNILPEPIADRLKQEIRTIAEDFAEVSVMFADIMGFTQLASSLSALELVNLLSEIFSTFDHLSEKHGLEKIKTIGDAYMVVGGLPMRRDDHAEAIAEMALDMQAAVTEFRQRRRNDFDIRIGINTGPVVAGVIGIKKFSYDLWGDTVNVASRMESHGVAGQIHVSATTYERLREKYVFRERGAIHVKGKGEMTTYFLMSRA